MTTLEEPIPLSALEHHEYCPRQAALIHVDGLWLDNRHTVRGHAGHRRADRGGDRWERGRLVLRSVPVWSEQHGLTGRCDVVEIWPDGTLVPVEYKIGTRHGRAAEIQLAAQAVCLEEMTGRSVETGYVWYARHQRRQRVDLGGELRADALAAVESLRRAMRTGRLPDAVNDVRCEECQLRPVCMPEIVADDHRLRDYLQGLFS